MAEMAEMKVNCKFGLTSGVSACIISNHNTLDAMMGRSTFGYRLTESCRTVRGVKQGGGKYIPEQRVEMCRRRGNEVMVRIYGKDTE